MLPFRFALAPLACVPAVLGTAWVLPGTGAAQWGSCWVHPGCVVPPSLGARQKRCYLYPWQYLNSFGDLISEQLCSWEEIQRVIQRAAQLGAGLHILR